MGEKFIKKTSGGKYSFYDFYDDYYDDYDDGIVEEKTEEKPTVVTYGGYSWVSTPSKFTSYYGSSYFKGGYSGGSYYDRYRSTFSTSKLGTTYYGVDFSDTAELMVKAYKETRDMVVIMDFPFKVAIAFSSYDNIEEKSGERFIFLETEVLDDSIYTSDVKINVLCGLGIHEACHLKYSTYSVYESFRTSLESKFEVIHRNFIIMLTNLIEDMRVESMLLSDRPGYSSLLQSGKDYKFKQYKCKLETIPDNTGKSFLDGLIKLIRFPDEADSELVSKYSDIYNQIKKIMHPLPVSTKEACLLSQRVYSEVIAFLKDGLSMTETEITDGLDGITKSLRDRATSEMLYGIDKSGVDLNSIKSSKRAKICGALKSHTASGLVTGDVIAGKDKSTFFIKEEGECSRYVGDRNKISQYIPAMKKIIFGNDKNYEFEVRGCRSGLLDTTKLAEAYQGVPQVYVRKGEVKTNKLAVCVVIDESGSMSWGLDDLARQAAILINEALGKCPGIELYIYGHSADQNFCGSTEIYIYREGKTYMPKYSLSSSRGRNENRDGTAIFEIGTRLRTLTNESAVMIVLSDGSPCAGDYYGDSARRDTRENVEKVEKMGINVVQATIGPIRDVGSMFKHHIDLTYDLANLPIELSKVAKKLILDNKKTTIS